MIVHKKSGMNQQGEKGVVKRQVCDTPKKEEWTQRILLASAEFVHTCSPQSKKLCVWERDAIFVLLWNIDKCTCQEEENIVCT